MYVDPLEPGERKGGLKGHLKWLLYNLSYNSFFLSTNNRVKQI